MSLYELQLFGLSMEDFQLEETNEIAGEMLHLLFRLFPEYQKYQNASWKTSNLQLLLTLYSYLIKDNIAYEPILDTLFHCFKFNTKESILCNISNLLHQDKIPNNMGKGTYSILKKEDYYELKTSLGLLKVQNARKVFLEEWQFFMDKPLKEHCFHRAYDFVKANDSYQVVLSYLPSYLYKGYYHAYLENETSILDIARNAYFMEKEQVKEFYLGEEITRLYLDDILQWEKFLKQNVVGFEESGYPTLGVLSWYLDYQNFIQEKTLKR